MLKRRKGDVIFISSVQGQISIPFRSSYSASKHALQSFADCLRAEIADKNVNVIVVNPGYIKTKLSLNALTSSGDKYNKLDETTVTGMKPEYIAERTLEALILNQSELTVAQITV